MAISVLVYGANPSYDVGEERYCDYTTHALAFTLVSLSNMALSLLLPAAVVTTCLLKRAGIESLDRWGTIFRDCRESWANA